MLRKKYIFLTLCLSLFFAGCMNDGDVTIILPLVNRTIPGHVISDEMLDTIRTYMPVNEGQTPPDIAGSYLVTPFELVYSTDVFEGEFHDLTWHADPVNSWNHTTYTERQGTAEGIGHEAYVIGSDDRFTLYTIDSAADPVAGWQCRMVTLISGVKRESEITDLHYAILMLDKRDEADILIAPDSYRIFADGDGHSPYTTE